MSKQNKQLLSAPNPEEQQARKQIFVYDCRRKGQETTSRCLETGGLDFNGFLRALNKEFSIRSQDTFVISTTDRTTVDFDRFEKLQDGNTLYLLKSQDQALPAATQEFITFTPHYNTLVEGGKHEYSTCEGKKPFPFALAELIDNALSATVKNEGPRTIEIRMLLDETLGKPAVIILDNGCGMSTEGLKNWAKYRHSKFERSKNVSTSSDYVRPDPVPRSLNSDISYFGVGGKHSAFYIGESTRMISKERGSPDVHELILSKEEFKRREMNNEDVFSTYIKNRPPGDISHVAKEERFLQDLIREEGTKESFTAVVITDVQPEHIAFIKDKFKMLTRQLAHIYHYYIHGFNGNDMRSSSARQDPSAKVDIQVTLREKPPKCPRLMNLREVDDDMQTLCINSTADTFEFRASLSNEGGKVEGIIRYHPFLYDRETYPQDPDSEEDSAEDDNDNNEVSEAVKPAKRKRPMFDCFWNGRLIPKNGYFQFDWCTQPSTERLPAECFSRFSGVLFTDDSFEVTTSKLNFVDLELKLKSKEIIFTRINNGKNQRVDIKRDFKQWLQDCHEKHDKQIKFSGYKETITRQDVPTKKMQHPWETFSSIEWHGKVYSTGQLVKSQKTQPIWYGTILRFLRYGKTEKTNGSVFATGGDVELVLEPKALHDKNKFISISKIDRTASDEAIKKHIEADSAKLPHELKVEWPEGNPWPPNAAKPAGTSLGPLKVEILNLNKESIPWMPSVERGTGKKLIVELKIVYHGPKGNEDCASFVAKHSAQWAYWFKKIDNLISLGKYTLTLRTAINENNATVFGGKELPSYKLNFSITEGSAQSFLISPAVSPTIHVGVPFNMPLQIQDAYGHPTAPPPDLKPDLKCKGLELSYEKADVRGTTITIKGVKAKGKVQNSQQSKTYDLKVTLPGLKEDTQGIKITLLPGNTHSLHVKPEDPITIENGLPVKFDLEVHDEAGNITTNPKQIVQCVIPKLPLMAIDCSNTGAGQITTDPINVKIVDGEPQTLTATFEMPSKKNVEAVVRHITVVPSSRVSWMELYSKDDENLVMTNNEKIEWLAGGSLENLHYKLYDEAKREVPLTAEIASKIKVTWTGDLNAKDLVKGKLPGLQVPRVANREQFYQVSYQDQSVSCSFYIIPRPDEPERLKVALPQGTMQLGEILPGNIILELVDQYENVTQTLNSTSLDDMSVTAEGLDQSSINFFVEESSSSITVTGLRFESGALGSREVCFAYRNFEGRVMVKVTAGVPAELKLVSGPETPLQVLNDHGIKTPFLIQLCDAWGNPSSDQRVVVELRSSPPALKLMTSATSQPVNAEGRASFILRKVTGPKGYYQLDFKGSFDRKPIPGPSVNFTVTPDPNKPVKLSAQYDTLAKFPAGGKFPVFSLTVESEEGNPITTFSPAAASMLLWKGTSSGDKPPQTATELKCSKPLENDKKDCFYFRDKDIPEQAGEYTIQFSLRVDRDKVLLSPQVSINVEANQPVKIGPNSQPETPVVSYTKDISYRTLVENMTLVIMDSYGNPAGQDLNGKVLISIKNPSEEGSRNSPLFDSKSSSCDISLVKGKAHIDRLTIMENSPGVNGSSYILLFQPEVFIVPLAPFELPFHFYNDVENQKKVFSLQKRQSELIKMVTRIEDNFKDQNALGEMYKGKSMNSSRTEADLRTELIRSNLIPAQNISLENIDRLITEKREEADRIQSTIRRVFPYRNQYREQPDVLGMVGHLAYISDDEVARVITWHIRGDMKCVVTHTTEAAKRIYHLTQGRQEVMALQSIYVEQGIRPLPHLRNGRQLFEPHGNPVYARDLLICPEDQEQEHCRKVFKNFLGETILMDDLDSALYYREMVVQCKMPCPTILTRQGDRVSGRGKFGGAQNKAPPIDKLEAFGAPLPAEHQTLRSQIAQLRQYRTALHKKDVDVRTHQQYLQDITSSEVEQKKERMKEMKTELEDIKRQILASPVRPAKRPGDAGEPSGMSAKRGRPT